MLWAFECSNEECAAALGITLPTFNKHYFKKSAHKAARDEAMLKLRAETLSALMTQVREGNVSAMDKMLGRIDRHLLKNAASHKPKKPERVGKKQMLMDAAQSPSEGSGWGDLLN